MPFAAQAAGLGQINVYSGLGQPLRAEIQVSATAEELQTLNARIASADAFRQANLTYGSAVSAIRVSVDTRGGRPVLRLTSDRPVNDPFVDLLVELDWGGRAARTRVHLPARSGRYRCAAPVGGERGHAGSSAGAAPASSPSTCSKGGCGTRAFRYLYRAPRRHDAPYRDRSRPAGIDAGPDARCLAACQSPGLR
ncbi:type IV pilus assembly protein FimV [Thauera sp. 28]|uniref:type IV pilus assembly protein FimV n=1 Tax=Thauera sp. 28 TaxID=303682 RepID=UPI003FCD462D